MKNMLKFGQTSQFTLNFLLHDQLFMNFIDIAEGVVTLLRVVFILVEKSSSVSKDILS